MNHGLADHLMHCWLEQVIRRQRGETSGLKAISLALSGNVSACCGVTPTTTRGGEWKCPECRQACEIRSWAAPRDQASGGDWRTMHVKSSRPAPSRREEQRLANEADRILWLSRLVEPWPRTKGPKPWPSCLAAYGLVLMKGAVAPETAEECERFTELACAGFGARVDWTTWTHRQSVRHAREVVASRAKRRRLDILSGDIRSLAV